MLTRRVLALNTIFCLLIGLLAVPRGPILVCRITGAPMAPVVVRAGDDPATCCGVTPALAAGDTVRYELTAPGCCDLRQDSDPASPPAIPLAGPETPAAALLPAPVAVPVPRMAAAIAPFEIARESAPRAPPPRSNSPRAPPVFS
jgi:hypothetical protein